MMRDLSRNPFSRLWLGPYDQEPEGDVTMVNPSALVGSVRTRELSLCKFRIVAPGMGSQIFYFHILNTLAGPLREQVKRECAQAAAIQFCIDKARAGKIFGWRGPRRQGKLSPLVWGLCDGVTMPSRLLL
jgi:hypothetical protein